MAHLILDDKFYSYRMLPWHEVRSHIGQDAQSVLAVADIINPPAVRLADVYTRLKDGSELPLDGYKMILGVYKDSKGQHTHNGEKYTIAPYGAVTDSYHLFPHRDKRTQDGFLDIWNDAIPTHCETLGVLGRGETVFVTAKAPSFDVRGDQIDTYLAGFNTCDGKTAVRAVVTPVRVVCANTMAMALSNNTELLSVNHLSDPRTTVREWLRVVWSTLTEKIETIQEACNLLASASMFDTEAQDMLKIMYPTPAMPETDNLDILAAWEKVHKNQDVHRQACLTLFQDSATITSATRGNAFGLYNAVVEYEDHGRARRQAASKFVGEGARRKEKAFSLCLEYAQTA